MFVGHYGVSFAAQRMNRRIPLWTLFIAVQFLDVLWAPLILLGIEKVRIVPGITASNPLDLYYMPFTHSLLAAVVWSAVGYGLYRLWRGSAGGGRGARRPCGVLALDPGLRRSPAGLAVVRQHGQGRSRLVEPAGSGL